ncbi:helix-turn-helix transcriptional regulator [Streptomyces nitrosporeus]|uniref:helix-turn-helix transcriptional regulator n=1 Tax=Streptomyces nitrosporeus TaxID=28894 RepID=UPI00332E71A0
MCHPAWKHALTTAQHLKDLTRLRPVRDRIDREYARPLDVGALARDANMPAGHLSDLFRLAYGKSPHAYLMARRVERVAFLMLHGDFGTATELRSAVGRPSPDAFDALFTELVGMTPDAYRLRARGGAGPVDDTAPAGPQKRLPDRSGIEKHSLSGRP